MPETPEATVPSLEPHLNAAATGNVALIEWRTTRIALTDADQLRTALAALCPSPVEVVRENGSWSVTVRSLPIAVEATDIDTAITAALTALRTQTHEHRPHNYGEWVLRQLIHLSDDTQLREWAITGACIHLY
ncbi:prevent-host-death protein [Nocardia macrotermitis]|uniref:Uncharacterized protein n=1 Tax=Nocardia macrotermitis TaxID=2585198 RepID=A0A7K0CYS6_9NOCA|nr:prevent-host-death protein [Nocardia macrotermitis]MQY18102.1 hypothetical protein [Nocardia macrotermitis]